MSTDAELAHRQSIGLNTLMDGSQGHRPPATLQEMIKRAILGSPRQGLIFNEIVQAIKERFVHYTLENQGWPVSGGILFIILFPERVSVCSLLLFHSHCHIIMFYTLFSISSDKTSLISAFSDQIQSGQGTVSGGIFCERVTPYLWPLVEGGQQHISASQQKRQEEKGAPLHDSSRFSCE